MSEEAASAEGPALARCPHCAGDHPPHLLKCPQTDLNLPLEGRVLHGKFRFLRQLGRGGMAAVWAAVNTLVDRRVAIKLIRPDATKDEEAVARFRAEAKAAGRIGHRNVCEILDFGLGPVGPYIVMERLRGKSLGQLIRDEERLDPALTVSIIRQALAGLEAAHKRGIIHRDLKPENLFIHQPEGGDPVVKIMDFGVSKLTDGSSEVVTGHGALLGTPEYMSPEQFKGASHCTVQTDIWAIGCILYKALTGQTAFEGPSVAGTLLMVTTEEPTPIPEQVRGVPPELVAIVERCLSKDPADRFESAQVLADELEPFDLETLATLALVDEESEGSDEEPAGPTVNVSSRKTGPKSVPNPSNPSTEGPETLLPTTRRRSSVVEERRPSRPDRRAWLLIGGVTVVGAGLLFLLMREPGAPPPTPTQTTASVPTGTDEPRRDLGAPAPAAASSSTGVEPAAASTTGMGHSTGGAGSTDGGTSTGREASTGEELILEDDPTAGASTTGGGESGEGSESTGGDEGGGSSSPSGGSRPSYDPTAPLPVPGGTVRVERYLTPKKPGPSGTHAQAKAYCRGLARQGFAGVSAWKMASPIVARKLSRSVRRGKYWTAALWKGKAIVIALPGQKQTSRKATDDGPRALCVAKWP